MTGVQTCALPISAAINTMANIGSFIGPYLWGAAKDATGGYHAGLMAIPVAYLTAGLLILNLRRHVRAKASAAIVAAVAPAAP